MTGGGRTPARLPLACRHQFKMAGIVLEGCSEPNWIRDQRGRGSGALAF